MTNHVLTHSPSVPVRRSIFHRAELVVAWNSEQLLNRMAEQLDLRFEPPTDEEETPDEQTDRSDIPPVESRRTPKQPAADSSLYPGNADRHAIWIPIQYRALINTSVDHTQKPMYVRWHARPEPAATKLLCPLSTIRDRIRRSLASLRTRREIDVPKLVRQMASRQLIHHIPRLQQTCWRDRIAVIRDHSPRLIPYRHDQQAVFDDLQSHSKDRILELYAGSNPNRLRRRFPERDDNDLDAWDDPPDGSLILVLGDLGALSGSRHLISAWENWGRAMKKRGCELLALVPCSTVRIPAGLQRAFSIVSWQKQQTACVRSPARRTALLRKIATLAASALRIEPGLLRDLRLQTRGANDASLEAEFWMSGLLASNHPVAATLQPDVKAALQSRFETRRPERRRQAVNTVRRWHASLDENPEIWFLELLGLREETRQLVDNYADDLEDARAAVREIFIQHCQADDAADRQGALAFVSRISSELSVAARQDAEVGGLLTNAREQHHPRQGIFNQVELALGTNTLRTNPQSESSALVTTSIRTSDSFLTVSSGNRSRVVPLSKDADISSASSLTLASDYEEIVLQRLPRPDWAVDFGRDRYGVFADFELSGHDQTPVRQRMRWIPPGQFRMGSPEDEPGRFDGETLRTISLTQGFWLFDTPCTQALWMAVIGGDNPSYFVDPLRPVEQVSWEDANRFASALSGKFPELNFGLPNEAQWEYACRAGTRAAIYTGELEIRGDANVPALDEIAWYGGNSGHKYDHEKSINISWLKDKQYEFDTGGTRQVAEKAPNPWGLFDMLGNVFEWCDDWFGEYSSTDVVDPTSPTDGSNRVVRGGCWYRNARFVRSAYRSHVQPGDRSNSLGFRCLSLARADAEQTSA